MSTAAAIVAVWCVCAVLAAILIGSIIREGDRR